ncbi:MAG: hypothetical protein JW702_05490 [Clostridiales bacterium]|nr:hypothetical protein [Clostridiales bacterium]
MFFILNRKVFSLLSIIAVCSITLLVIESNLKYLLFIFQIALTSTIFWFINKNSKIKIICNNNLTSKLLKFVDYVLTICLLILLLLNIFKSTNNYFGVALGIIASFYFPGWALIRITKIFSQLEIVETFVLSVVLSIPITATIFSFVLLFPNANNYIFLTVLIGISIILNIKTRGTKERNDVSPIMFTVSIGSTLIILLLVVFFSCVILTFYPTMSLVPQLDIVRNFSWAKQLSEIPSAYNGNELWFSITEASAYLLTKPSIEVFQTLTAFLSIILIFSFYILSKTYLKDLDERLPALATTCWGFFSGFGWLYFMGASFNNTTQLSYNSLLYNSSSASYFDTGYGQGWMWFWFRALTLGLTILFAIFFMLKQNKISKKSFILISSSLILALNFVHFPESAFFVAFLFLLSIIYPTKKLRLADAGLSIALSMALTIPFLWFFNNFVGMTVTAPNLLYTIGLGLIGIFSYFFARIRMKNRLQFMSQYKRKPEFLIGLLGMVFIWLLLIWVISAENFSISSVAQVWGVPWQFYPMLLGVCGLFAIPASISVTRKHFDHPVVIFVFLLIFAIVFGRILTYININLFGTGYWERRIVPISYAAASIIGSLTLLKFLRKIIKKKPTFFPALIIGCIVFSGVTSTWLSVETTNTLTNNELNNNELQIVNKLNELNSDKVSLTVTDESFSLLEFAPASWRINNYRIPIWSAQSPELPLNVLYSSGKQVCTLVRDSDFEKINQNYDSSYLGKHIVATNSSGNPDNDSSIISFPQMSPPSDYSNAMLILPSVSNSIIWYAYDILSEANINYTTVLIDDLSTIAEGKILIAPTEEIATQLVQYKNEFNLSFEKLIILNLNGYDYWASKLFPNSAITLNIDEDSLGKAELILDNERTNNISTIVDAQDFQLQSESERGKFTSLLDNNLDNWSSSGSGNGNISLPELRVNNDFNDDTNSSLEVKVESGVFAYWQIEKTLTAQVDFSDSDFISFYWYGKSNEKNYVLEYQSGSAGKYWYYFTDNWEGWKKVIIPMQIPDGKYRLNEISFVKVTTGLPVWNNITKVRIRNEGSNPDLSGNFMLSRFGFESTIQINMTISAQTLNWFELFNYQNGKFLSLGKVDVNRPTFSSEFIFMDGINSTMIMGENGIINTSLFGETESTVKICVNLPPYLGDAESNSIKLRFISERSDYDNVTINSIRGKDNLISLNTTLSVIPLITNNDVISWYSYGEKNILPFTIADNKSGVEYFYINLYPLIINAQKNEKLQNFSYVVKLSSIDTILPRSNSKFENPVEGNLIAFKEASFVGNTTITSSKSSVSITADNELITLNFNNNSMSKILRIIFPPTVTLNMHDCKLNDGSGFYSTFSTNQTLIYVDYGNLNKVIVEYSNGTKKIFNILSKEIQISGNSYVTLRQPKIYFEGEVEFDQLFTYAALAINPGILGYDTNFQGELSLEVNYGDRFTVANDFNHEGIFEGSFVKYKYNEIGVLIQYFPLLILISVFYLMVYLQKINI